VKRLLLLKYGEVALKGKNRPLFERALNRNLSGALGRALSGAPGAGDRDVSRSVEVRHVHGRFYADLGLDVDALTARRLAEAAARVFGIVGVAAARRVPLDLESITVAAIGVVREVKTARPVRTFKLEVRRANKTFPLGSPEIATIVGRRVLEEVPGVAVDVHEPDLRVGIEVRDDAAYLYGDELPGPGGLPVGTSGRAVALISGGIDSPVAMWMAMKRGLVTVPLHFWSYPFTGERARQKVVDLCSVLAGWGPLPDLLVCPFTDIQTQIRDRCPEALRITLMRRMMMRVAARVAGREEALAVVTGESLGQVASQTLESLATIEAVIQLPVLRPLIGLDKEEIVARARSIGTYDISTLPYADCCTLFVPSHPRTKPSRREAESAEKALEIDRLVGDAVAGIQTVEVMGA